MNTYLVGYDLNKPRGSDDYEKLRKTLREHSGWYWAHLDSTFIIKSNNSATQIANLLKQYLDSGDELLVVGLTGEWASLGFTDEANKWLHDNVSNTSSYVGYRYF